jgi:hypothetical protein
LPKNFIILKNSEKIALLKNLNTWRYLGLKKKHEIKYFLQKEYVKSGSFMIHSKQRKHDIFDS